VNCPEWGWLVIVTIVITDARRISVIRTDIPTATRSFRRSRATTRYRGQDETTARYVSSNARMGPISVYPFVM